MSALHHPALLSCPLRLLRVLRSRRYGLPNGFIAPRVQLFKNFFLIFLLPIQTRRTLRFQKQLADRLYQKSTSYRSLCRWFSKFRNIFFVFATIHSSAPLFSQQFLPVSCFFFVQMENLPVKVPLDYFLDTILILVYYARHAALRDTDCLFACPRFIVSSNAISAVIKFTPKLAVYPLLVLLRNHWECEVCLPYSPLMYRIIYNICQVCGLPLRVLSPSHLQLSSSLVLSLVLWTIPPLLPSSMLRCFILRIVSIRHLPRF